MDCDTVQEQVSEVAEAVGRRTDELAATLARTIKDEVPLYRAGLPVGFDMVVAGCAANIRPICTAIADDVAFDTKAAAELGVARARDGVPLSSVMEAYRVGFRRLWDAVVTESTTRPGLNGSVLHDLTAKLWAAQGAYTDAMAVGHRAEQGRRFHNDEAERAVLMDTLLYGRVVDECSVWDAADFLRLPSGGPYVVVAAEADGVGREALPQIESKLRSLDVFSAWRVLPDLQVGIVHVRNDKHLGDVLALLSRVATARVGVSARFDDLRDTPQALRFARISLRGRPETGIAGVAVRRHDTGRRGGQRA